MKDPNFLYPSNTVLPGSAVYDYTCKKFRYYIMTPTGLELSEIMYSDRSSAHIAMKIEVKNRNLKVGEQVEFLPLICRKL